MERLVLTEFRISNAGKTTDQAIPQTLYYFQIFASPDPEIQQLIVSTTTGLHPIEMVVTGRTNPKRTEIG
jgi:hypothetical protein